MIDLELNLVIGKGRTGDFTVLFPGHVSITSEAARLSASWLQIHATHSAQRSVALWRQEDRLTLGCAWQESGVDNAGRPLQKLAVYIMRKPPPYDTLVRLMLWLYRQNFDGGHPPAHHEIASASLLDDDTPLVSEERDRCAATLALLQSETCRVQGTRTAQGVIDALGFDQLGFIALVPNAVPSWPTAGPGVVLSRSAWQAPSDAVRLVGMGLRPGAVDLAGLMRMPRDGARRKALALAAVSGDCAALGGPSDQELDWLIAHDRSRMGALARASGPQLARVFDMREIDPAVLDDLTPQQLGNLPPSSVAGALRGRPDAVARFVAIFGPGNSEIATLLPGRVAGLLRAADGPVDRERLLDLTPQDMDVMEQAGIFETMSIRWLAQLWAVRPRSPVDKHLARRLRELLPAALVSRLVGSSVSDIQPAGALSSYKPPSPSAEWLVGIAFDRLVDAGTLCAGDRAWRRWWADAVTAHPDAQGREIATLTAPWSPATVAWLVGSARDGEISAAAVRARIAAFINARAPIPPGELTELLRAAGVTHPDALAALVQGSAQKWDIDERFAVDVQYLREAGILSNEALQDALRGGLPIAALSRLVGDPAAIRLLDDKIVDPTCLPSSWHPLLTQILRERIHTASFWNRWRRGVPTPLLTWLRRQLDGEPETAVVDALIAAGARTRALQYEELKDWAGALTPLDLVWQVVENLKHGHSDRRRLVDLLENRGLRAEFLIFLRRELDRLVPAASVPALSVPEMLAVLPLLHPVRDVVRQVMSQPSVAPEEDALRVLTIDAIRRAGCYFPLPPPSTEQAARRPSWVSNLAELAGWEHWRGPNG
jgi:hypothetical protein